MKNNRTHQDPINPIMRMTGEVWREYIGPKVSLFDQIESLPEKEKLILALHYYEGLSFSEICYLMEVEEQDVITLHTHALTTLGVRFRNTEDTRH